MRWCLKLDVRDDVLTSGGAMGGRGARAYDATPFGG